VIERPPLELAAALVSGGKVQALPPQAEALAALDEQRILLAAIAIKTEELAALASRLSHEICERHAATHADGLRRALAAAADLFQALESNRELRARLVGAGYTISEAAIAVHLFPTACMVGHPDQNGSPANQLREFLRSRGIEA
jgi:hypothetical protein